MNKLPPRFDPFKDFIDPPKPIPVPSPIPDTPMTNKPCTPEILSTFAPALARQAAVLSDILNNSVVNTPLRLAHFLAQTGHESGRFTITTENMNYSEQGLLNIFPKYFPTPEIRREYARQPERIGNRAYANRMGNGPESSGDGFRYRGRGYMQVTGKDAYRRYSLYRYGDDTCIINPELLALAEDAMGSAIWYWELNNLNRWADRDDVMAVSRAINLGNPNSTKTPNGMQDRRDQLARAKKLLKI